jgi:hypothetical protein
MKPAPLFVTDAEIAALVGLTKAQWQIAALALEKGGLIPPDPLFENKRYWPAVKAYLDRRANLGIALGAGGTNPARDGEEQWNTPVRPALKAAPIKQAITPVTGLQNALQKMQAATP